jgi:hypothetical protein
MLTVAYHAFVVANMTGNTNDVVVEFKEVL